MVHQELNSQKISLPKRNIFMGSTRKKKDFYGTCLGKNVIVCNVYLQVCVVFCGRLFGMKLCFPLLSLPLAGS